MTNPTYHWILEIINALSTRARVITPMIMLCLQSAAIGEVLAEDQDIEDSVIKIYTTQAEPDYFTPWRLLTPRQSSGSGAVIENNRI
ncbi:MAG: hypothetical protein VX166_10720, partial [Pseudomonadota bacterium]|nr:hypothetical protein [Pseudomonadota bacterium]